MSDSALRCLLGLIHLSFRFDPEESTWVHPGDFFSRSDVEVACGLSSQGTRNGLGELESIGWAHADRTGRSHQYRLTLKVPDCRFTYVPTALLENVGDAGSGTQLRVVLAVLRRTWGWTCKETNPESGQAETVHDRWARLSNAALAEATGRSETAICQAAKALQGQWIERIRPGNGAYQYRFLPEAIGDGSGDSSSFSGAASNDLPPDRQQSDPPSSSRENTPRDRHARARQPRETAPEPTKPPGPTGKKHAVPSEKSSGEPTDDEEPDRKSSTPDFSNLPPEKKELAEKLANVGVWSGRIAEILTRYSPGRIRANFELFRQRAAEQIIRSPGAWLYAAITDGYALPDADSEGIPDGKSPGYGSLPPLEHKEILSEEKKDTYVARGVDESRFHRCPSGRSEPGERRFMYFDPEAGGPDRRV